MMVERYEAQHFVVKPPDPVAAMEFTIEQGGLSSADLRDDLLPSRREPIQRVPPIVFGSMPNDGGHLLMDDAEKTELLAAEPAAAAWVKPFLGAEEFINGIPRWCLWLKDCPPAELAQMPFEKARSVG